MGQRNAQNKLSRLVLTGVQNSERTAPILLLQKITMREIVHLQTGQCGNQIGAKVDNTLSFSCRNVIYTLQCLYLDG